MDKVMTLSIMTGNGELYNGQSTYINLPTPLGSVGILPGHAAMLCAVSAGTVVSKNGEATEVIPVGIGVAEVARDTVTLLVQVPLK